MDKLDGVYNIGIPEEFKNTEKPLTVKEKVYNLISKKDMTTDEVANELEISNRFARECIKLLKLDYSITETRCRCGHTPIYKVK